MAKRDDVQLEKSIPLTNQEFRSYRGVFNMKDQVKRFVAGLLEEFMEGQQAREDETWDSVAQQCGFNSHDEMLAAGRYAKLDFATREIKLFKKGGDAVRT